MTGMPSWAARPQLRNTHKQTRRFRLFSPPVTPQLLELPPDDSIIRVESDRLLEVFHCGRIVELARIGVAESRESASRLRIKFDIELEQRDGIVGLRGGELLSEGEQRPLAEIVTLPPEVLPAQFAVLRHRGGNALFADGLGKDLAQLPGDGHAAMTGDAIDRHHSI